VLPQHLRAVAQGEPALGVVAHEFLKTAVGHDLIAERGELLLDAIPCAIPGVDFERVIDRVHRP
jgi:hypothetical protein